MRPAMFVVAILAAVAAVAAIWANFATPQEETPAPQVRVRGGNVNADSRFVQLYVVAIDDGGKAGPLFGCNDSLISLGQKIPNEKEKIAGALEALFAYRSTSQTSYTALTNAVLQVDSVSIENKIATVNLSGQYEIAGECDGPRFIEQIKATVTQFDDIDSAVISVNGQPLDAVASLKGE